MLVNLLMALKCFVIHVLWCTVASLTISCSECYAYMNGRTKRASFQEGAGADWSSGTSGKCQKGRCSNGPVGCLSKG
jgi:hypothetical protein